MSFTGPRRVAPLRSTGHPGEGNRAHLRNVEGGPRVGAMIVRRDQKVKLISRVPLFQGCSQAELARVAAITTQVEIPEGEVLMREGEPGQTFVILVAGSAEVRKGKRHIGTLGAGDFAGEIALLTNVPRTATVRTTSHATALRATRKGFAALLDESPSIERKVLRALADRIAPTAI